MRTSMSPASPLCAALLAILALARPLAAQDTMLVPERLHLGQMIRVRLHDGNRLEGRIQAITEAPPVLELPDHARIDFGSIDSLWIRGNASRSGALTGAALVGGAAVLVSYSKCRGGGGGEPVCTGAVVLGAGALGALLGSVLGSSVGSYGIRWELAFARPPGGTRERG